MQIAGRFFNTGLIQLCELKPGREKLLQFWVKGLRYQVLIKKKHPSRTVGQIRRNNFFKYLYLTMTFDVLSWNFPILGITIPSPTGIFCGVMGLPETICPYMDFLVLKINRPRNTMSLH